MHIRSTYVSLNLPNILNLSGYPFTFATQVLNPVRSSPFEPLQAEWKWVVCWWWGCESSFQYLPRFYSHQVFFSQAQPEEMLPCLLDLRGLSTVWPALLLQDAHPWQGSVPVGQPVSDALAVLLQETASSIQQLIAWPAPYRRQARPWTSVGNG